MFMDNVEDIDIVMPMYDFIEYRENYSMTLGSFWNYYRDQINGSDSEINYNGNEIKNDKRITRKSFEYKTKITGRKSADNNILDAEVVIPLKCLSNLWRFLDLPLINCEIKLDFSWSKECKISEILITPKTLANLDANPSVQKVIAIQITGAKFQINNAKRYVPQQTNFVGKLGD